LQQVKIVYVYSHNHHEQLQVVNSINMHTGSSSARTNLASRPVAQPSLGTKRGPDWLLRRTAGKAGIRNMTAPDFFDFLFDLKYISVYRAPLLSFTKLWPKVGQSTPLLPVWPRLFSHAFTHFRIKVNFTAFRTISGIFESISGFRLLFVVHKFRFVASVFLIGGISSRLSAIRQPYGPEYGQKGRPPGDRGQTGSRNMATTQFLDSATPISYLNKSRPKYTTTSGFANPLQVWPRRLFYMRFSNCGEFHDISDHFGHFWMNFRFLNCTSGPKI